jgi:hypothetical protein
MGLQPQPFCPPTPFHPPSSASRTLMCARCSPTRAAAPDQRSCCCPSHQAAQRVPLVTPASWSHHRIDGTDSMLLGSWTRPPPARRPRAEPCHPSQPGGAVLDVGTGCGVLALMLAQSTHGSECPVHGTWTVSEPQTWSCYNVVLVCDLGVMPSGADFQLPLRPSLLLLSVCSVRDGPAGCNAGS